MTKQEAINTINELLSAEPFFVEDKLTLKTEIRTLKHWDSLKHLSLLVEMEERFQLSLEFEKTLNIVTIGDLVDLIAPGNTQ